MISLWHPSILVVVTTSPSKVPPPAWPPPASPPPQHDPPQQGPPPAWPHTRRQEQSGYDPTTTTTTTTTTGVITAASGTLCVCVCVCVCVRSLVLCSSSYKVNGLDLERWSTKPHLQWLAQYVDSRTSTLRQTWSYIV